MNPKSRSFLTVAFIGLLFAISSGQAATLTWNNGGATGNWNTIDLNWTGLAWNNATPDDAVFDATGVGTVTLSEAITAGSLTFNTAGYTIDTSTFGLTLNTGITANQNATIQSGVGGSIILGANNTWSVATSRTLTVSSPISGASFGITKSGAGTLTLSGANTYGGGTTLSGGTVAISNATAFGAASGNILVTANTRINAAALTYANAISINTGTVLSLQNAGAASSTATFSGAITGAGGITLVQGAASGTTIALTNANNTFTGNLTLPTGTGANDFISFASIGDGGSIIYGRPSWRGVASYTGSANLTLNTRTISLATTFGGATGIDGGGSPINLFQNNGTGTVTINTNMGMTTTASSGFFWFGGSNTGNNTFSGTIADPTGANTLGIGKWDAGKWILSNTANTYEGTTWITNGTLSVNKIDVAANAQSLGKGSLIIIGHFANTGTLEYTGSTTATTDKQVQIGTTADANGARTGGATILNNGTGSLTFSNAAFNSTTTLVTAARTLTLGGSYTGSANEIQGVIQNNAASGLVSVTKTGPGTWILGAQNTYTGATSVNGGILELKSGASTIIQTLGALAFAGGDGTLRSNRSGVGSITTTFNAFTARTAGNTGNIVSTGGTNGTDNIINLTGAAGFIDKGLFFNGADFAARDSLNGYVRALAYGTDTNAAAADTITAGKHVKLTSTPGTQAAISLLSLNLSGSGVGWITTSGDLTAPGIIKSGGGSQGTISGGNLTAGAGVELVIRTDTASDSLLISSNLTQGSGILTKSGAGTLTLSGTNTYTGQTHVNGGILSIDANVRLGAQTTGATLNLKGGTLQATSTFGLFNGTAGTNNRAVVLTDTAGFDVTGSNTLTVAGVVSGTGGFNKSGTGNLTLSGTNTYTGATNVNAGKLIVNGSISTSVRTTVASGATIGGSGNVGALTIQTGGTVTPGNSPGILNTGDYTQAGLYVAEIEGIVAGNSAGNHDQINVTGTVNISGGSLTTLFSTFTPVNGDLIFILLNDGTDAITGTYTGLAQGAVVNTYNGFNWTISYTANSGSNSFTGGNDIALLAVIPEPASALLSGIGILLLLRRRR